MTFGLIQGQPRLAHRRVSRGLAFGAVCRLTDGSKGEHPQGDGETNGGWDRAVTGVAAVHRG
jgi:hypothetical protein